MRRFYVPRQRNSRLDEQQKIYRLIKFVELKIFRIIRAYVWNVLNWAFIVVNVYLLFFI